MGQQLNSPPRSSPVSEVIHPAYSVVVQTLRLPEGRERHEQVQAAQPALPEAAHATVAEKAPTFTDGGEYNKKKSQDSSADAVNDERS